MILLVREVHVEQPRTLSSGWFGHELVGDQRFLQPITSAGRRKGKECGIFCQLWKFKYVPDVDSWTTRGQGRRG
ncbi:MAG: hypothetical protein ACYDEP_10320 [Acidimicrobiales bacterium]|jgi:hypothetical protein